jgi:hypothetical protein
LTQPIITAHGFITNYDPAVIAADGRGVRCRDFNSTAAPQHREHRSCRTTRGRDGQRDALLAAASDVQTVRHHRE